MLFSKRYGRYCFALFCLLTSALSTAPLSADEADFPLPPSLEPAVEFWIRVYTQADTESGFLHDSQNLNVIYEKLPRDSDLIEDRRKAIAADLKLLASGTRTGLNASQQQLLDLWGASVSNERLAEAASNIRWQLGQSDRYQEGLYRSGAYLPHIRDAARSLGLPEELASLPHVESSFHPGAFSSVAASGMFQFMRETGKRFMRVDNLVDERLDPYKSARAAMRLLKENYEDLGNWPLALTAYNHGTGGMMRAVRDSGTSDIGEIVAKYKGPRFGFASRNFYAQFLAAREVELNAERFFGPVARLGAPQFAEYEMTGFIDAGVVAGALGVSLEALKQDNPALLAPIWNGNKRIPKGYVVKVNRNTFAGDLSASINGIASSNFYTAQVQDQTYTVQGGDSLSVIARRYNTSISELVTINQLANRNALKVGQKLVLPQQNGTVPTLVVNATAPVVAATPQDTYTVARGDTLSRISSRFNVPEPTLMALNNLRNANVLQPGQKLVLHADQPVTVAARSVREEIDRSVQNNGQAASEQQQREQADAVASMIQSMNPADYAVSADGFIEVLPEETLGHYADWLRLSSNDLYRLNNLRSQNAVRVGTRLKLDFSKVDQARFESRRQQFHSNLQSQYFASWRISDTANYKIRQSDSLAAVARANDIPMWLFRQYNPGVEPSRIQIGQTVVIPRVQRLSAD
jgi:membrane-bound lytic murein transglycosylase D